MPKQHVLIVKTKVDGFRRAGRAWSVQPTTVDPGVFTKAQLAALRADPMLSVIDSQVDVAEDVDAEAERDEAEAEAKAKAKAKADGKATTKGAKNQGKKAGK